MSTRAQIEFVAVRRVPADGDSADGGGTATRTERRRVYNHSDGYPDGVFPALRDFHDWIADGETGDRTFDGPEYTAANFLYFMKRRARECLDEEWAKLGYGVCAPDQVHGDVEWFYRVELRPQRWVVKAWHVGWDTANDRVEELVAADEPDERIEIAHPGDRADLRQQQFADQVPAGGGR